MKTLFATTNARRALALGALAAALALTQVPRTVANDDDEADAIQPELASVVRVEEDWSLSVDVPNADIGSPQISTQMAPAPDSARFCNVHMNSADLPSYSVGGLQLQVWNGRESLGYQTTATSPILNTHNELITWTQYLKKEGEALKFGVSAAQSDTWGDFSGMQVTVPGASTNLANYDADYSVLHSGVTFGANRVKSLVLVRVRVFYSDNTYEVDDSPRQVYARRTDPVLNFNGN